MDLTIEKTEIIKKVDQVNDEALLHAIKNLLDFGLSYQLLEDHELEDSINRGLAQLEKGEGRPHEVVMKGLKEKHKK